MPYSTDMQSKLSEIVDIWVQESAQMEQLESKDQLPDACLILTFLLPFFLALFTLLSQQILQLQVDDIWRS